MCLRDGATACEIWGIKSRSSPRKHVIDCACSDDDNTCYESLPKGCERQCKPMKPNVPWYSGFPSSETMNHFLGWQIDRFGDINHFCASACEQLLQSTGPSFFDLLYIALPWILVRPEAQKSGSVPKPPTRKMIVLNLHHELRF